MNHPIFIGRIKEYKNVPNKQPVLWVYRDVKYDADKWAKASEFIPESFDLCHLKTDTGKTFRGWHTGHNWDGLNIKSEYKIEFWKRYDEKQ